jgi:hypothetical protein
MTNFPERLNSHLSSGLLLAPARSDISGAVAPFVCAMLVVPRVGLLFSEALVSYGHSK